MTQTLIIPAVGPSLNQWYSGGHWSKRSRTKNTWRMLVRAAVRRHAVEPVTRYPVRVDVLCRFGKGDRSYDCTNIAATAKLAEDGLVHARILQGDSRRYVRPVTLDSIRHDGPSDTVITITEGEF